MQGHLFLFLFFPADIQACSLSVTLNPSAFGEPPLPPYSAPMLYLQPTPPLARGRCNRSPSFPWTGIGSGWRGQSGGGILSRAQLMRVEHGPFPEALKKEGLFLCWGRWLPLPPPCEGSLPEKKTDREHKNHRDNISSTLGLRCARFGPPSISKI